MNTSLILLIATLILYLIFILTIYYTGGIVQTISAYFYVIILFVIPFFVTRVFDLKLYIWYPLILLLILTLNYFTFPLIFLMSFVNVKTLGLFRGCVLGCVPTGNGHCDCI